jgi:cytochrome c biogenesis protein CcdA/thiol-disulfide isomerase/thioredoxin
MIIAVLAFLGGALTILSPCILPVLPFVFARSGQSFARSTAPLLAGMAVAFSGIATLAAVGGAWAVRINDYGRLLALILLAASGLTLLSEHAAAWMTRPFVAIGNRLLSSNANRAEGGILSSLVLGVATGFLWAPCAGPILGLILTGAAINGPSAQTTLLLFAYALGGITSLAVAMLAGSRVFVVLKRSFGAGDWLRRGLGAAVIAAVIAIALGWDTGVLTRLSLTSTNRIEQSLIDAIHPDTAAQNGGPAMTAGAAMTGGAMAGGAMTGGAMMSNKASSSSSPVEGDLPSLDGAATWLNSSALTPDTLRGKVVVIDFWTYSCINCLRALPYVKSWYDRYKDQGLVVIGVHSPEFAFEKSESNVRRAIHDLGITYPVALDNNYAIWQAFNNRYWPAHYFVDAMGRIRGHHFGEGNYEESEQQVRQLLAEAGAGRLPDATLAVKNDGMQAAADEKNVGSSETYIGYERAAKFASPGDFARDQPRLYSAPPTLELNQWALTGNWRAEADQAVLLAPNGSLVFRFHARDLHLVLGPGMEGKAVRFRVTLDGKAPGPDHGADTDAGGAGIAREHRLYQLLRQSDGVRDRTFAIEFLDPGVQVYSFTFG